MGKPGKGAVTYRLSRPGLVDKRKEGVWAAWENGCTRSMGVSGDGKATRLVAQGT